VAAGFLWRNRNISRMNCSLPIQIFALIKLSFKVNLKTSGDKFKTENLASMGGKGLFVKEIEQELLNNNIDCAVHSLKDVPTFGLPDLKLAAFLKRKDERDAFISPIAKSFEALKPGSTVGTSSVRRVAQLKN